MIQGRRRLRFTLKAGQGFGILPDFIWQELQGGKSVQVYVFRLIDDTHPTTAQLLDDAVVRNSLVDHCGGILRRRIGAVNVFTRW